MCLIWVVSSRRRFTLFSYIGTVFLKWCLCYWQDKKECPKWLGIGLDCVMQFNFEDKQSPTRVSNCNICRMMVML